MITREQQLYVETGAVEVVIGQAGLLLTSSNDVDALVMKLLRAKAEAFPGCPADIYF